MTQYAILTDLNRCVGCLACTVSCKVVNSVPIGSYWLKVLRVGPFSENGGNWPDVYEYFLPMSCQHCANPACVEVCPTGASMKMEDGTVQIDKELCIGCEACLDACPYGVRYINEDQGVAEKCTLCEQQIAQGELPQCVAQCNARARFFGKVEEGFDSFVGAGKADHNTEMTYEASQASRVVFGEFAKPYTEADVHYLPDSGNGPSFAYILRGHEWQGNN